MTPEHVSLYLFFSQSPIPRHQKWAQSQFSKAFPSEQIELAQRQEHLRQMDIGIQLNHGDCLVMLLRLMQLCDHVASC